MAQVSSGRIVFAAVLAIFVYGVIAAMLGVLLASFNLTPEQNGTRYLKVPVTTAT